MKIIGGSASENIASNLSDILSISQIPIESKRFVDSEFYLRIKQPIRNEDIIIVQTTYPDENIIELFLLLDAVAREGANSSTVIIPYLGYARQDKQFKGGEPVSAEALAKLISVNADKVITVDPHKEHILPFFTVPAMSVSASSQIAEYFKNKHIDGVLAPDKGAFTRAKTVAEHIRCDMDYLEKTRINDTTIQIRTKNLDVAGKSILIVDDIISTGGTMAVAIKELLKQDAEKIFVSCTHGLFAGNAIEKLKKAGCEEIVATDTIFSPYSKISVAHSIAKAVQS